MVLVAAGPFEMGSTDEEIADALAACGRIMEDCDEQGFDAEAPRHTVTLNSFYIDQFEVTNAQFAAFLNEVGNQSEAGALLLDATDEDAPLAVQGGAWTPLQNRADHPIVEVTWYGAQAYCEWRGARLPTEAEWEKAARWDPDTGESLLYPWGDEPPTSTLANYGGARGGTRPVGSYPEGGSPVGAYDMAGNVFEWTADWYAANAYETGDSPTSGERRVLRGGSWGDFGFLLRAANRGQLAPNVAFNFVGFRCVRDP
jgi:formylglycine-generating enzyme required for sulfatase activity